MVQKKFTVLRVVSTIFKVMGWIVLVTGVLSACGSLAVGAMPGLLATGARGSNVASATAFAGMGILGGVLFGVGVIFFAVLYFLLLYAFGDMIHLLVALEENTRLTAERLMGRSQESGLTR